MNTSCEHKNTETKWQTVKTSQLCVKKISITPAVHSSGHNTVVVVKYTHCREQQYQIQMFFLAKQMQFFFTSQCANTGETNQKNNDDDTNNGT